MRCTREIYEAFTTPFIDIDACLQHGHRAELWNVNEWLAPVAVKVIRFENDEACIRLLDQSNGELFAECPIQLPLVTCVEPVIDSSRYFVLRIVDQESGKHAFIGLGFRERSDASNFNAALHEYDHYMERQLAAQQMRLAHETTGISGGNVNEGSLHNETSSSHYALQPGQTMRLGLNINGGGMNNSKFKASPTGRGKLMKTFSLLFEEKGVPSVGFAPVLPTIKSSVSSSSDQRSSDPMGLSPVHKSERDGKNMGVQGEQVSAWGDFTSAE